MVNDSSKQITKSALLMTVISFISLLFSFFQESVFAFFFGANSVTDAYTVATQIPITLFSIVSTAISTIVIPCYSKEYFGKGAKSARKYVSNLTTVICVVAIVFIIICEIFARPIMLVFAPGMEEETRTLAIECFRIVLPTVLFTGIMNINIGVLNVHKKFVLPALTSNILNLTFVVSIVILHSKFGIFAAIFGTVCGTLLELFYSIILRRGVMKYAFVFDLKDEVMKQSIKMMGPVFLGIGAAEINKVVDRIVSSYLQSGSITIMNYASKLSSAVSTLLINSIATVIYPRLSENGANKNDKGAVEVFSYSIKLFMVVIIPIIFGGVVLSKEIIKIIYYRGEFSLDDIDKTAPLFACYLVCLLFTAFRQTSSRVFYSYGDSKTPMYNSLIGIILNIILNIVLGHFFGAFGLVLATTVSTAFISFLLFYKIKKMLPIKYITMFKVFIKCFISASIMAIVIYAVKNIFLYLNWYNYYAAIENIICVLSLVVLGGICYFGCLVLFSVEEAKLIIKTFMRRKKDQNKHLQK